LWGFASSALNQAALPVLARLQSDRPRFRQAYFSALQFATLILYPCFVGLAVTAPEVVQVVFGRVWAPSAPYVTMVALLVLFRVPRHLSRPVLTAVGVPQGSLIGSAVELMVIVAGFAVLRPQSLPLVMTIWVAREILVAPVSAAVLARVSGFGILDQVRATLPAGQASAVTAVGVILTRMFLVPASWPGMIRLLLLSIIGAFAFCATAWLVEPLAVRGIFSFFASAVRRPKVEAPSQS
jgi:PST family polysaccharide transporter